MDSDHTRRVATSDYGDEGLDERLSKILAEVRERTDTDVVFVSRFAHGERTFMAVQSAPGVTLIQPGMSDPLDQSWCNLVVQGRLPAFVPDAAPLIANGSVPFTPLQIGTHLSVPIVMADGGVYGTLCCFALSVKSDVLERDVEHLRDVAKVVADHLRDGESFGSV